MPEKKGQREVSLPPPPDTVELRQSGQALSITPPVKRLDDYFSTVTHYRGHDPELGGVILPVADPLVWEVSGCGRSLLRCLAGLKGLIEELLVQHGLRVKVVGEPPALATPDREQLSCFGR